MHFSCEKIKKAEIKASETLQLSLEGVAVWVFTQLKGGIFI